MDYEIVLIYGFEKITISTYPIHHECPQCGAGLLTVSVEKHFFDLLRIFFIPYKTSYKIDCPKCLATFTKKDIHINMKSIQAHMPFALKTCVFVSPLICLILFAVTSYMNTREEEYIQSKIKMYLSDLRVGDKIIIKDDNKLAPYTILTINRIMVDKITYVPSQFHFSKMDGVWDQMLNPQRDNGMREITIKKEDMERFQIVDIYGPHRYRIHK